jgi:type I restriction enzyme M protein
LTRAQWGHERFKAAGDPFGRIRHLPKKSHGEMAFVQHMVASLGDGGRMAVVLPNGCFFRGGAEQLVRRDLIEEDVIEAVVQLPKDMFFGAGIPACWLVLNRAKRLSRRAQVLFIDGSELFERVETKNVLRDDDIDRIVAAYRSDDTVDGLSAFAANDEIAGHRYNLTVRRYVRGEGSNDDGALDLDEAVAAYRSARKRRQAAEETLDALLSTLEEI